MANLKSYSGQQSVGVNAVEKQGEVHRSLTGLTEMLNSVCENLSSLEQKLKPVTRVEPSSDCEAKSLHSPIDNNSVWGKIVSSTEVVKDIGLRIQELIRLNEL